MLQFESAKVFGAAQMSHSVQLKSAGKDYTELLHTRQDSLSPTEQQRNITVEYSFLECIQISSPYTSANVTL